MAIESVTDEGSVKPKKKKNLVPTSTGPAFTEDERRRFGVSGTGGIDQRTAIAIMNERRGKKLGGIADSDITKAEQDAYNSTSSSLTPKTGAGGGAGYASMLKALQQLSAMSQQGINDSMDSLTKTLQAQTNPFANFQAQQTQTTPGLEQLLQSQGVATDPLQQYASAINAQNTGQADAFNNIAKTLSGLNTTNQQGMIADVGQQRSDLLNQLQGNVFGTGARLMGKKAPDRNAIIQMILQSMKNRA